MNKILDCTLRDGGYVNDWNFGNSNIRGVMERLIASNVDAIEIGFLDERVQNNHDKTIMPDMQTMQKIFGGIEKNGTELVAMVDIGTFDIDKVLPKSETCLDGIRVIFQQHRIDEAMAYCKQLKAKGYKVFANAVMITKYKNDEEILDLISKTNEADVDAVTFVDTYGIMYEKDMEHCYRLFESHVKPGVDIGFHSHNTIQMSLANCIKLSEIANPDRTIYMDSTLLGMGKGSGNTNTELLMAYANHSHITSREYGMQHIMAAIEKYIEPIQKELPWSYSLDRSVSAMCSTYYKYTEYYRSMNLSYEQIVEIEELIEEKDRFSFSESKAQSYYDMYKNKKRYSCVVFDLDGTLLDTRESIYLTLDQMALKCGLRKLTDTEKTIFLGPGLKKSIINMYGITEQEADIAVRIFREAYQEIFMYQAKIYDGVVQMLQTLKANGVKVGIASNKREDLVKKLITYYQLDNYFVTIHGSDYAGELSKTDIIKRTIDEMKPESFDKVLIVGDTEFDRTGATDLGINFIGVMSGYGFSDSSEKKDAVCLVRSTKDISKRII